MRTYLFSFTLFVIALVSAAPALAESTSIPRSNQPLVGPTRAIEDLAQGYRDRSPDAIGAVLTADYTFHGVSVDFSRLVVGSAREFEMGAVRGLLLGVRQGERVIMPAAERVEMAVDGVSEQPDPEHPDSTEHYRVLTVRRFETIVHLPDGKTLKTTAPGQIQVFHVVRGDAAVRAENQPADPMRWYIRRWLEDVSGVRAALNERKGECGDEPAPAPTAGAAAAGLPGAPLTLAIHALTNPACSALKVSCDLPGNERAKVQVYDVSGRLMNERSIAVTGPGTITVDAGAGVHLLPGIYWVRLAQAKQAPNTRMGVVAR